MPTVDLDEREWQAVLAIIMNKEVWVVAHPLLQRITGQLEAQRRGAAAEQPRTNSGEHHGLPPQSG